MTVRFAFAGFRHGHIMSLLAAVREADDAVQSKLDAVMEENEEFRELVARLEDAYDMEQSGDEELLRQLIESIDLDGDGEGERE